VVGDRGAVARPGMAPPAQVRAMTVCAPVYPASFSPSPVPSHKRTGRTTPVASAIWAWTARAAQTSNRGSPPRCRLPAFARPGSDLPLSGPVPGRSPPGRRER
jgi:hypothetical protein